MIETSFNITDRGIVVVGEVIAGIPTIGKYLSIDILGKNELFQISGTERGKLDENGKVKFGLLLSIEDPHLLKHIRDNKINPQTVDILDG